MKKNHIKNNVKNKNNLYCGNCGKYGHIYRRCTAPITSLGIICYKKEKYLGNELIKYLMIQRRDTLGFVEFMRGKYNLDNVNYIYKLFEIMTKDERNRIENNSFDYLWNALWMDKNTRQYHNEYDSSKKKFYKLKNGIDVNDDIVNLQTLNETVDCNYYEPEWGFPKGRRNLHEDDYSCSVREFEEESGLTSHQYKVNLNIEPLDEIFLGSNNIRYRHIYYVAEYTDNNNDLFIDKNNFTQVSEVSNIKWFTYEESLQKIRPYNQEKKLVLNEANSIILKI